MTDSNKGPFYAILAFTLWGLTPIYFKALASASAIEIIAHRILWSVVIIAVVLLIIRRYSRILGIFRAPRLLAVLMACGLLVGFNWTLYVWSVNNGYLLQSSLGYYINPLFNIVLGVVILKERHGWWQWIAVGLATMGVLNMIVLGGEVPWIALGLASSFGAYGVIRKIVPVGALDGLFIETLLFSPVALGYLIWLDVNHTGQFASTWRMSVLLIFSGAVTTIPLISFAAAAKRLRLSTLGFLQFITPTMHFLFGVFAYGEKLTTTHMITFTLIWIALGVYSWAGTNRQNSIENTA
jgi:chloramphenicol-sensitive protein RarD